MYQRNKTICIFGGSGFLGRFVTEALSDAGYRLKIATRYPESVYDLKPYGSVGQIAAVACDYKDDESLKRAIEGSDAVINLVGILFEKGKNSFQRVHTELPERIAKICAEQKIKKFVHVSALGIDESQSNYAKSKLAGEKAIHEQFPAATILRPSVVFGPGDGFFNMFAKLSTVLPALPLIGGGHTKFQPVYAGDIAQAILKIINEPSRKDEGQTYHLGGPEIVTFKEIYEILFAQTNRKRALIPLPFPLAKIQGAVMGVMPKPMITLDQVRSLQYDNIVKDGADGFEALGIQPKAMASILPDYLACYKKGGRFGHKKTAQKAAS